MHCLKNLLVVAAVAVTVGAQCPAPFFEAEGGCFHALDSGETDISWEDAREMCIGLSESGWKVDLASIDSTSQLEAFAEAWATAGADYRPYGYMWVGFTRESGQWANLDGVPVPLYSNMWREGHPHDMNMYVYIEDVTMTSGTESRGRFYASCTMQDALQRALCRAYPA
ncbi:uncharacterized protein LOC122258898 [Penaeus japonicus]|uniref:uncharacterized protein LOC122258898 n=1 Tax=Penaeus japonicus TaxID=27405 RepID=UPI001C70C8A4|nr:uncharacterized protein LOC122258898 [Penaeus japonicus]